MVRSRTPSQGGGSQGFEMERKYSVPSNPDSRSFSGTTSEDLHAWSIYRQNLNSDFTDSALGSTDKSPLPYGNFQLRDTTVQSILSHPRYGPKSTLGANMYTYLKFGLPRVFPPHLNGSNRSGTPQQQHFVRNASARPHYSRNPKTGSRGHREGSSGYDSSDNETNHHHHHHQHHQQQHPGHHLYKQSRKYRSDPDFRMHNIHPINHHSGAVQNVPNIRPMQHREKSISEANLLAAVNEDQSRLQVKDVRRFSVADFGHLHDHHLVPLKPDSHLSVPQSRLRPPTAHLSPHEYIGPQEDERPESTQPFVYPHFQALDLGIWPETPSVCCFQSYGPHLLVNDISFEVHGGEILAIMATNAAEGTAILDVVAGVRKPALGDMVLNGQAALTPSVLRSRVAYVRNNPHIWPDLTAIQMLRFHYGLKRPTEKLSYLKIGAMERITVLLEELGLEQVRDTKVSAMTVSERRRLDVACHLLLDTDIIALDQPTQGMDIFDTFFLVEYLRQWAICGTHLGRIVIMTLHPPTYEIFTMVSRVLLVSAGRTMFSGKRTDMLPYFSLADYPCPAFKNPSDYYLDLVTLDDLSAEAMLESSQRIEQLTDIFRQKQITLHDPGPPSALPMSTRSVNIFGQAITLILKSMIYSQPNTFIHWLTLIVIAASLSLITGAIFWDIPVTDPQLNLNDRLGYHFTAMCLMPLPLLMLITLIETVTNRRYVERDISDGLYSRILYITTKIICNLIPSTCVWLIYLVPSYSMSGLFAQSDSENHNFYTFIGTMVLYFISIQQMIVTCLHLLPFENYGIMLCAAILSVYSLSSGYVLHFHDIPKHFNWLLSHSSPVMWLYPHLLSKDLSPQALALTHPPSSCRNKLVHHRQDIIVQSACPVPNGTQVLFSYGFLPEQRYNILHAISVPTAIASFLGICIVLTCVAFSCNCLGYSRKKGTNRSSTSRP